MEVSLDSFRLRFVGSAHFSRTTSTRCWRVWTPTRRTTPTWASSTAAARNRSTCHCPSRSTPTNYAAVWRQANGWSTCANGPRSPPGTWPGSLAFELSTNFVTYLGWLYTYGTPLTLIGDTEDQVADARRELVRIGIDALSGAAIGDITALSGGRPLRSYPVTDFAGLAEARKERDIQVIDARRNDERAKSSVTDSIHIPLHELADRLGEVPDGEVWVYCGSGYRASIAASVLDRHGHPVVLINDAYDHAEDAGLTQS